MIEKTRLVRWDQTHLHTRYILTEKGGVKFENGLDGHDDSPRNHCDVDLLQPSSYKVIRKEYQRESPIFILLEDDLILEGIA